MKMEIYDKVRSAISASAHYHTFVLIVKCNKINQLQHYKFGHHLHRIMLTYLPTLQIPLFLFNNLACVIYLIHDIKILDAKIHEK
jgi:hypothetical protein